MLSIKRKVIDLSVRRQSDAVSLELVVQRTCRNGSIAPGLIVSDVYVNEHCRDQNEHEGPEVALSSTTSARRSGSAVVEITYS